MRVVALLAVMFVAPAFALADPAKEAQANVGKPVQRDGILGMFGAVAAGMIITPPPHADAAMVVTPPDPNDPMNLELGTNQLQARTPRGAWLPRDLSLGIGRAADKVWDFVLPKL